MPETRRTAPGRREREKGRDRSPSTLAKGAAQRAKRTKHSTRDRGRSQTEGGRRRKSGDTARRARPGANRTQREKAGGKSIKEPREHHPSGKDRGRPRTAQRVRREADNGTKYGSPTQAKRLSPQVRTERGGNAYGHEREGAGAQGKRRAGDVGARSARGQRPQHTTRNPAPEGPVDEQGARRRPWPQRRTRRPRARIAHRPARHGQPRAPTPRTAGRCRESDFKRTTQKPRGPRRGHRRAAPRREGEGDERVRGQRRTARGGPAAAEPAAARNPSGRAAAPGAKARRSAERGTEGSAQAQAEPHERPVRATAEQPGTPAAQARARGVETGPSRDHGTGVNARRPKGRQRGTAGTTREAPARANESPATKKNREPAGQHAAARSARAPPNRTRGAVRTRGLKEGKKKSVATDQHAVTRAGPAGAQSTAQREAGASSPPEEDAQERERTSGPGNPAPSRDEAAGGRDNRAPGARDAYPGRRASRPHRGSTAARARPAGEPSVA
ncbi:hypothetical protein Tco_0088648 [Tanacetum coccineum]